MICAFPATQPDGAAIWQKARRFMDVILHIGAHFCAPSGVQIGTGRHRRSLTAADIGYRGAACNRLDLLEGLLPGPGGQPCRGKTIRAIDHAQMTCDGYSRQGRDYLEISDENMLGLVRSNLRFAELYSGAGERIARLAEAFAGYLSDIVLTIRSPEGYWAASLASPAATHDGPPPAALLHRIADSDRSWRDVITDVSQAAPEARVHVIPFEGGAGRPDARHRDMIFSPEQGAELRERYADDLLWLVSGAEGRARLTQETQNKAGPHLPETDMREGRYDERRHRQVARAGRS